MITVGKEASLCEYGHATSVPENGVNLYASKVSGPLHLTIVCDIILMSDIIRTCYTRRACDKRVSGHPNTFL